MLPRVDRFFYMGIDVESYGRCVHLCPKSQTISSTLGSESNGGQIQFLGQGRISESGLNFFGSSTSIWAKSQTARRGLALGQLRAWPIGTTHKSRSGSGT